MEMAGKLFSSSIRAQEHSTGLCRAGRHFDLFNSILGRVKIVNTHNHSLLEQYVTECQEFDIV